MAAFKDGQTLGLAKQLVERLGLCLEGRGLIVTPLQDERGRFYSSDEVDGIGRRVHLRHIFSQAGSQKDHGSVTLIQGRDDELEVGGTRREVSDAGRVNIASRL